MNVSINNYISCKRLIFVLSGVISFYSFALAQGDEEKHRTYLGVEYTISDAQKMLIATLTARIAGERGRQRVEDAEVAFFYISDTSEILLGEAITNVDGDAFFELPPSADLELNSDGEFLFMAVFKGNSEYREVSKDITIKPMTLELSFIEIDSVKNIVATAYEIGADEEKFPVEEDVVFYVPSQFSLLQIGEAELEEGEATIAFPVTLPGDSVGNLKIIARVEESRDYGTVEVSDTKNWGMPRPPVIIETRRGLGDTDAPLWMVYTLIVLMSTVWFHYMYLLYVLFVIKSKGKEEQSFV